MCSCWAMSCSHMVHTWRLESIVNYPMVTPITICKNPCPHCVRCFLPFFIELALVFCLWFQLRCWKRIEFLPSLGQRQHSGTAWRRTRRRNALLIQVNNIYLLLISFVVRNKISFTSTHSHHTSHWTFNQFADCCWLRNRLNAPEFVPSNIYASLEPNSAEATLIRQFTQIFENFALHGWAIAIDSCVSWLMVWCNCIVWLNWQKSHAGWKSLRLEANTKRGDQLRGIHEWWPGGRCWTQREALRILGWILHQITEGLNFGHRIPMKLCDEI